MSIFAFICPYQLLTLKKKVTFRQLFSRPGPYDSYGSSGPGRGKSWTNVTFFLKVRGFYGQRKAKIHTLSSPTILS